MLFRIVGIVHGRPSGRPGLLNQAVLVCVALGVAMLVQDGEQVLVMNAREEECVHLQIELAGFWTVPVIRLSRILNPEPVFLVHWREGWCQH